MATDTMLYEELNRAWKSTTNAYFGKELGELPEETYAVIKEAIVQHIVAEMVKRGKDLPEAGEKSEASAEGENTVVSSEETTPITDESSEAKA